MGTARTDCRFCKRQGTGVLIRLDQFFGCAGRECPLWPTTHLHERCTFCGCETPIIPDIEDNRPEFDEARAARRAGEA